VRVLPKLKYKKEKPPEPQSDYTLPLAAGGVGLLALLGASFIWWRKKQTGKGPLKIWQGFRKKKAPEPAPEEEFVEVKTAAH
jgi:pilus assembly protein FimV